MSNNKDFDFTIESGKAERQYLSTCILPADFLNDGTYFVGLALTSESPFLHVHFYKKEALQILITDKIEGTITRNGYAGPIPEVVRPSLDWSIQKL
jgi:lipopolysaccharide transport system ATP-binding protein